MERDIVCFGIPAFEIALARLNDSSLCHRPIAVVPALSPRAVVLDVSTEAVQDGIWAGMPLQSAVRLSRSLHILLHDSRMVHRGHQLLEENVSRLTPVWEAIQSGHVFLDLTGTRRLFGPATDSAMRLAREINQQYGLRGLARIGSNKLVSRLAASMIAPPHLCDVQPGSEAIFVAPALLSQLPGLAGPHGQQVVTTLTDLNVKTLGDVTAVRREYLACVIGTLADVLHGWARGIDHSKVWPKAEQPSFQVSLTLPQDEIELPAIWRAIIEGAERLCRCLRQQQRACRRLHLAIEHADSHQASAQQRLSAPTYWEVDMVSVLRSLLEKCFRRRVRIRRLSLQAHDLVSPDTQLSLYETADSSQRTRRCRLSSALDTIRAKYGEHAVSWGNGIVNRTPTVP